MGVQSLAILLRVYNCSIFSSHVHGYTQSCMATNAFAGCIIWYSFSIWPHFNDYYDVYFSVKNKVEYYFIVHIVWFCWMGIWWFCRYSDRMVGTNVYLHNTLNIVGHIHLVLLVGSVLLALGLVYSILPSITGRMLGKKLGIIHLFLTIIGGFGLAFLFLFLGFAGFIRREGDIPSQFLWAMPWLMFFALVVGFGQIVFAYNVFRNLKRRMKTNEIEYEESRNERFRKEQNSYINQAGEIIDISFSLLDKKGGIDKTIVGAEEKEEIEIKIRREHTVYDKSFPYGHINKSNRS